MDEETLGPRARVRTIEITVEDHSAWAGWVMPLRARPVGNSCLSLAVREVRARATEELLAAYGIDRDAIQRWSVAGFELKGRCKRWTL